MANSTFDLFFQVVGQPGVGFTVPCDRYGSVSEEHQVNIDMTIEEDGIKGVKYLPGVVVNYCPGIVTRFQ